MKAKPYITPTCKKTITFVKGRLLSESLGRSETKVTNDNQVYSRRASFWSDDEEE